MIDTTLTPQGNRKHFSIKMNFFLELETMYLALSYRCMHRCLLD